MRATVQATFVAGLHDFNELVAPPGPVAVVDDVGRVGHVRSVVSVELARLVRGTVVVRVADRRHAAVGQALHTTIHLEHAGHFVDHPFSTAFFPSKV